ncbi:MAG: membrane protein insertion efficiency factor YidD [Propionibacteriaceae bacterium]|nr:membrane protein insertion efficiency factor YidD [Propionibacteriaceae bacterium]
MKYILMALIRAWRAVVSPWYGPVCKYYPSCSAYALEAVAVHGAWKGAGLAAWRLLRCNPWSNGGVDPVPGSALEAQIAAEEAADTSELVGWVGVPTTGQSRLDEPEFAHLRDGSAVSAQNCPMPASVPTDNRITAPTSQATAHGASSQTSVAGCRWFHHPVNSVHRPVNEVYPC